MKNTVKSKQDMEKIFSSGEKVSARDVAVIVLPSPEANGRVAFVAGKKLGNAPLRNRSKRVLREAARELGAPWPGLDVVFVARRETAICEHDELLRQCRRCLVRAGILEDDSEGARGRNTGR